MPGTAETTNKRENPSWLPSYGEAGKWPRVMVSCSFPPARWGLLDFMWAVFSSFFSSFFSASSWSSSSPTAMMCAQCSVSDLNRDHVRSVFLAGPQPWSGEFSVPRRTSTARQNVRRYLKKNVRQNIRQYVRKNVRQNVRRYVRKNVRRYVRKNVREMSERTLQDTSERMPEEMSKRMAGRMAERIQKICQKGCQKRCQTECKEEYQKIFPE